MESSAPAPTPKPPRLSIEALRAYRQALTVHFVGSIAVILVLLVLLLQLEIANQAGRQDGFRPPIVLIVVLAGALGALFSALQRLYKLERLPVALLHPLPGLRDWHLWMYSLIPPIVGMIGAVFFYLVLASGLIEGPLFQQFRCDSKTGNCDSLAGLLSYSPCTATDYAKSIVWGFVSGISERLVPDTLAKLDAQPEVSRSVERDA